MLASMGKTSAVAGNTARSAVVAATPHIASSWVRSVLESAIDGVGPVPPAAVAADAALLRHDGQVEEAVAASIRTHTALASAEGFVTNIGGVAVLAVAAPVNVTGLALIKCHLVAGIAHLRGYDLEDPRVRNAILTSMLGRDTVEALITAKKLPSTPMAIATAPADDPELADRIGRAVTTDLVTSVTGRRVATMVGRRIPLLGGAIGATGDALSTYLVGVYASQELPERRLRR